MKKLIFLVAIVAIAYFILQKKGEQKREMLVGTWMMERDFPWGAARMHINLKPEGDFYIVIDAASRGGQTAFAESSGKWAASAWALRMNFTKNGVPGWDMGTYYGGQILTLDEKTLTYKSRDGVQTWKRAH